MSSNLDRFKKELESLIRRGDYLLDAMKIETHPEVLNKYTDEQKKTIRKKLPNLKTDYQSWYSEAKAVVKQLLPDRLDDFVGHYEKPKGRKDIDYENYKIIDYLQGLTVTKGWDKQKIVEPDAAIPQLEQQLSILKSANTRFESSLFDIRQMVQADLLDSELEAAVELAKTKFTRAAGAVAGVVLEKHLGQVCDNHDVKITKNNPTISNLNDALKAADVIDIPQWRFIQHLGDLRNLCDHDKKTEPTPEQVRDLIEGVQKTTKTLF